MVGFLPTPVCNDRRNALSLHCRNRIQSSLPVAATTQFDCSKGDGYESIIGDAHGYRVLGEQRSDSLLIERVVVEMGNSPTPQKFGCHFVGGGIRVASVPFAEVTQKVCACVIAVRSIV